VTQLALGIGVLVVFAALALWLERRGRIAEREKQHRENLGAVDTARQVEREVAGLSDADLDDELRKHRR